MNKRKIVSKLFLSIFTLFTIISLVLPFSNAKAEEKTYIIATDVTFAPFEFQDENGDFVGIDMDLLKAIAEDQGFKYQVRPLGFNAAVQALEAKQVDAVIAGMSITDERKLKFDFSDPYFDSGVIMAVDEDNNKVSSYEDLKGERVAVKTGTEGAAFAQSIQDKYGFKVVTFDDSANMYEDVKTGNSIACFDDYPVLAYGVKQGNGLKIVTDKEAGSSYGFAVAKGENTELLQMFNDGLSNLKASGEYQKILDKYLETGDEEADSGFFGLLKESFPSLMSGLKMTIILTVVSLVAATILGVIFGLFQVSNKKLLRAIATIYVDIFRGTPLLVQAFFIYFGVPAALDIRITAVVAGIITLSLNAGAYIAEIVRGGIQSIDKGQMEASRSLGLPYRKAMSKVVLPQAIRIMIPSFINQFVITLKDTSILSIIGINELTQSGKIIIARNLESFQMWLIVGIIYFIIIMILTKVSNHLERRIKHGEN